MSFYAIGIGGTSARCVESLIHLCAMGLGPDKLHIIFVDPDEAHGNLNRVKVLISRYLTLKEELNFPEDFRLFKTEITFSRDENNQPIYAWSPVREEKTLSKYFKYHTLSKEYQDLCQLLYTRSELEDLEWDQGFRGRASVGAPVMAGISKQLDKEPWHTLIQNIKNTLGNGYFAKLFIFATIFGATGASGFPTIAKILRDKANEENWGNKGKFKIGGALLLPYFSYNIPPEKQDTIYAHPEHFILNAKTALSHYHFLWREGSPYDAVYLMGERILDAKDRTYAEGGINQENPVHYIELLSALSALDFYFQKHQEGRQRLFSYYAGREVPKEEAKMVNWQDIPLSEKLENEALFFTSLGIAYLSFYLPLIKSEKYEEARDLIPWDADFFRKGQLRLEKAQKILDELASYFYSYLRWVCEFHLSTEQDLRLFNKDVLKNVFSHIKKGEELAGKIDEESFKTILAPEARPYTPLKYGYDELWEEMCRIKETIKKKKEEERLSTVPPGGETGEFATGKLVLLLYKAIKRFCNKNYGLKLEEE